MKHGFKPADEKDTRFKFKKRQVTEDTVDGSEKRKRQVLLSVLLQLLLSEVQVLLMQPFRQFRILSI